LETLYSRFYYWWRLKRRIWRALLPLIAWLFLPPVWHVLHDEVLPFFANSVRPATERAVDWLRNAGNE